MIMWGNNASHTLHAVLSTGSRQILVRHAEYCIVHSQVIMLRNDASHTVHAVLSTHLDAEEHRTHLCQPFWVHSCHTLHVLLAGVHQLMVHNVVRGVAQAVQGAAGVQEAGHPASAVVVLPDALQLGCIVEVGAANGFADNVPVRAGGGDGDLLLLHDVQQLRAHLLGLLQPCTAPPTFVMLFETFRMVMACTVRRILVRSLGTEQHSHTCQRSDQRTWL